MQSSIRPASASQITPFLGLDQKSLILSSTSLLLAWLGFSSQPAGNGRETFSCTPHTHRPPPFARCPGRRKLADFHTAQTKGAELAAQSHEAGGPHPGHHFPVHADLHHAGHQDSDTTLHSAVTQTGSATADVAKVAGPGLAVFTYGSLRHDSVYSRAIGGPDWASIPRPVRVPGVLKGFSRHPVKGAAYPAMIFTGREKDEVDGDLSYVPSDDYLAMLDEFEGDDYARLPVTVHTASGEIQATAWVWIAGEDWLDLSSGWSFADFVEKRLESWLAMSDEDFLVVGEIQDQLKKEQGIPIEVSADA